MKQNNRLIGIALAALVLLSLYAACASTSVSAAGYPIPAGTGPSACYLNSQYQYLFVKGYDGALWYKKQNVTYSSSSAKNWGWAGWVSLGGKLDGSPVALSRSQNIITVYITTGGIIYEKCTSDGGATWQGYYQIDGTVKAGTEPASAGSSSGREDVFWIDASGNLWQKTWISGQGWKTKINLGHPSSGGLTSSPGAITWATGRIDVHASGANGADYYRSYYDGVWHAWATLGGVLKPGTGPALGYKQYWNGASLVDREDVLVTGTNGAMYQKTWKTGVGWTTTWTNLGGQLTSSPTVTKLGFCLEVWARFSDGRLYLKEYTISSETWWPSTTTWSAGILGPP